MQTRPTFFVNPIRSHTQTWIQNDFSKSAWNCWQLTFLSRQESSLFSSAVTSVCSAWPPSNWPFPPSSPCSVPWPKSDWAKLWSPNPREARPRWRTTSRSFWTPEFNKFSGRSPSPSFWSCRPFFQPWVFTSAKCCTLCLIKWSDW